MCSIRFYGYKWSKHSIHSIKRRREFFFYIFIHKSRSIILVYLWISDNISIPSLENNISVLRFATNKTFREKMRKILLVFRKLFRENEKSDKCENEAKSRENNASEKYFHKNHRSWSCILSFWMNFGKI